MYRKNDRREFAWRANHQDEVAVLELFTAMNTVLGLPFEDLHSRQNEMIEQD
jgi:hypothetical protein